MKPLFAPDSWLVQVGQTSRPLLRLFCFPYAGASAQIFAPWSKEMPDGVELWALQPPGRGPRLREPLLTSISDLAAAVTREILPFRDLPFAFFGHSKGALVAFETSRQLRNLNAPMPVHLILSGTGSPDLPPTSEPIALLPKEAFIEKLRQFNGTPPAVFDYPELLDIIVPILRADFTACESYWPLDSPPLDIPFTVFGGDSDPDTPEPHLQAWARHSSRDVRVSLMPGGHFFLHLSHSSFFLELRRTLERIVNSQIDYSNKAQGVV